MPHHQGASKPVGRPLRGAVGIDNQNPIAIADNLPVEELVPISNMQTCCNPLGCSRGKDDMIDPELPRDSVRVLCNNENCDQGNWMHGVCFELWEQHVLSFLKSCGRARSWSEKQRMQNLWTKKGYDLAFKVCDCKCGRGHIRKDLDYIPLAKSDDVRQKKIKKKSVDKCPMTAKNFNYASAVAAHNPVNINGSAKGRLSLRIRTSSMSSTGSSPPSSGGTPPLTPSGPKTKFDFFADAEQAAAGNIFRRRADFSVFNCLPRYLQNAYHIKMEDEGPHGNDETRCFVLTSLSTHQITSMSCATCSARLPVYDKYPLIDGTFFLSPQSYNSDVQVLFQQKMLFLNAVCMRCLMGTGSEIRCHNCHAQWLGAMLVIGTMYSYDIFAAMPCCEQRLNCKNCHRPIINPNNPFQYFSEYSKVMRCPHCKTEEHHFIRPVQETFTVLHSYSY